MNPSLNSRVSELFGPEAEPIRYFIVGCQKSGTTWLRDCLDVFVPFCKPEWYFPEIIKDLNDWGNTYGAALSELERNARLRAAAKAVWREVMGHYRGEKSAYPCSGPHARLRPDVHPLAVRTMKSTFPDCRLAVIVRDPRAVYNSLCHYLDGFRPGWSTEIDIVQFATGWARQNRNWIADDPDAIVFYEKLKTNFHGTLRDTLVNMSIEFTESDVEKTHGLVYSVDDLRPRQPEIYRSGTIDEWKIKVPKDKISTIVEFAGDAMIELGYQIE